MARGDANMLTLSLTYAILYTVRPPSGDTWMITGMAGDASAWITVLDQGGSGLYTNNAGGTASYRIDTYSPINGGCKLFITNSKYFKLYYANTTNTPKSMSLWYVEV